MLVCTLCNLHCLLCNYLSCFNYHLQFSYHTSIGKGQSKQVVMTMQPHTDAHSTVRGLKEMSNCTASLINNGIGERYGQDTLGGILVPFSPICCPNCKSHLTLFPVPSCLTGAIWCFHFLKALKL
jgi:hypothetical protein